MKEERFGSGMQDLVKPSPDSPPARSLPGMGDHPTAVSLFGGIMLALYRRMATGKGGRVSTSLMANVHPDKAVRDVMTKTVLCLPIEASISEAASIIVNKNVDPLPLTREGKWVGLISRRSLIRKLLQF